MKKRKDENKLRVDPSVLHPSCKECQGFVETFKGPLHSSQGSQKSETPITLKHLHLELGVIQTEPGQNLMLPRQ